VRQHWKYSSKLSADEIDDGAGDRAADPIEGHGAGLMRVLGG
jgi:hypothetical protein